MGGFLPEGLLWQGMQIEYKCFNLWGEKKMSENSEKDAVDQEEAIQENMFQISALIAILEQKGLLTRQEVLEEVQGLKRRQSR